MRERREASGAVLFRGGGLPGGRGRDAGERKKPSTEARTRWNALRGLPGEVVRTRCIGLEKLFWWYPLAGGQFPALAGFEVSTWQGGTNAERERVRR